MPCGRGRPGVAAAGRRLRGSCSPRGRRAEPDDTRSHRRDGRTAQREKRGGSLCLPMVTDLSDAAKAKIGLPLRVACDPSRGSVASLCRGNPAPVAHRASPRDGSGHPGDAILCHLAQTPSPSARGFISVAGGRRSSRPGGCGGGDGGEGGRVPGLGVLSIMVRPG